MQKTCKQFIVFDAGLVVNSTFPYLGVSPDEKVYDPTEKDPFGLLEIKNPYTWRNQWRQPARIQTSAFKWLMARQNLKKLIKVVIMIRCKGKLAVTGLPWCDFVVNLSGSRNINVERIYFNQRHCDRNLFF